MNLSYLFNRFCFRLKKYGLISTLCKLVNYFFNKNKIDLDELKLDESLSLDDVCLTFGTDKGLLDGKKTYDYLKKTKPDFEYENYFDWVCRKDIHSFDYPLGSNYTPFYKKYFENIRKDNLKILEIGVANGHSTASFYHYFPNAQLYGVDIKKPNYLFYSSKRINYKTIDILDKKKVQKYLNNNNEFDIIIDDSLHTYEGYTLNLRNFLPGLKNGGIYVLEDFNSTDLTIENITDFNKKHNRNPMVYGFNTTENVFDFIRSKKYFDCRILSKNDQEYLMKNISKIESYRSEHPYGSIAFIHKEKFQSE